LILSDVVFEGNDKNKQYPPIPMQYVTLCHKFTVIEEELFLQYDNRRDADIVFIFGTRASLEHLERSQN